MRLVTAEEAFPHPMVYSLSAYYLGIATKHA